MRQFLRASVISVACVFASALAAVADIEHARDLMEAGEYERAMEAFWPAERSGNADAEELIGVMYAPWIGG